MVKIISLVLVCLFFINDIAWALDSSVIARLSSSSLRGREAAEAISKLSPRSQLTEPEFLQKFALGQFQLSMEGVRNYVDEQLKRERDEKIFGKDWKAHRSEIIDINDTPLGGKLYGKVRGLEQVVFIKLSGLLAFTGQLAWYDLTGGSEIAKEFGGLPIVVIDSMYCNAPDKCVQKHEIDEILQWEDFRVNVLHISTVQGMGDWIRKYLDPGSTDPGLNDTEYKGMTSRRIAELFCGCAYPVRDLHKRIAEEVYANDPNRKAHFDIAHINKMLAMYPASETKGVNVAAKAKESEPQPPAGPPPSQSTSNRPDASADSAAALEKEIASVGPSGLPRNDECTTVGPDAAQVRRKNSDAAFVALTVAAVLAMGVSIFVSDWYFWLLLASPLLTKCATALTLGAVADFLAQKIEQWNLDPAEKKINIKRLAYFSLINMVLCGFALSFWLDLINWIIGTILPAWLIINVFGTNITAGLIKIGLQAFPYTPLYYLALFPSVVIFSKSSVKEALSGKTFREGINAIRRMFWPTYKRDFIFWTCLVNPINFIFMPLLLKYLGIDLWFVNGLVILINGIAGIYWETRLSRLSHKAPVILKAEPVVVKEISGQEIRDFFSADGLYDLLLTSGDIGGNKIKFSDFLHSLFPLKRRLDITELGAGTGWFIDELTKKINLKEYFDLNVSGTELSSPRFSITNEQALAKFDPGSMDMVAINAPDRDKVNYFLDTADRLVRDDGVIYFTACRESTEQAFEWLLSRGYYAVLAPADGIFKKGSAPSLSRYEKCGYRLFASKTPKSVFARLEGCDVYHGKSGVEMNSALGNASGGIDELERQALIRETLRFRPELSMSPQDLLGYLERLYPGILEIIPAAGRLSYIKETLSAFNTQLAVNQPALGVTLEGAPIVTNSVVNAGIKPFFEEKKNGGAKVIKFKMAYEDYKEGKKDHKKVEEYTVEAYVENGETNLEFGSDNPMKGLDEPTKKTIRKLLKARSAVLKLKEGSLPDLDDRESFESIQDALKDAEIVILPGIASICNGVVSHAGLKQYEKRIYLGSVLIDSLSESDLALFLLESARYIAKPIIMDPVEMRHNKNVLDKIEQLVRSAQESVAPEKSEPVIKKEKPVSLMGRATRLARRVLSRAKKTADTQAKKLEEQRRESPLEKLSMNIHKLESINEDKNPHEVEEILKSIEDALRETEIGLTPVITLPIAERLGRALVNVPFKFLKDETGYYRLNSEWHQIVTGLVRSMEPIDPDLMKRIAEISLIAVKENKRSDIFDMEDVSGATQAFYNLPNILETYHPAIDMKTIETILKFGIKDIKEGYDSRVWQSLPIAIKKLLDAQRWFSKEFMDFFIRQWDGSLAKYCYMEDCFASIIESPTPLTAKQIEKIQGKLLLMVKDPSTTKDVLAAFNTIGSLLRSGRPLHKEERFLHNAIKEVRRHADNAGKVKGGYTVHFLSFITGLLGSGRKISDEDREYFEKLLWRIFKEKGTYTFDDGTLVDAFMPYLSGLQGKIKGDISFGNIEMEKRLGPFWQNAFGITTEAFSMLDLKGLAAGSQALVKIELLKEALKKGSIDGQFTRKIIDELIPSLRVIEKLSDIYPTLGVETKKQISSEEEGIAASWQAAILNYLSAVQIPTALGKSYVKPGIVELRIPPTVYPVFRRLMREIKELLFVEPTLYHTSVAGDYADESRFLLSSFFFTATPSGSSFPVNPDDDSYVEWAFPGYNQRYIGATIDPWKGKLLTVYDEKTHGTQTNFFHTAVEVKLADGTALSFYEEDIRRVFLITTAAAATHSLYEIKDPGLAGRYEELRKDVLKFYIDHLYISENDLELLTAPSKGKDHSYSDATNDIYRVLRRISRGFIRRPGDTEKEIEKKRALHEKFQEMIAKHVDLIEAYIFPQEFGEAVKMTVQGGGIRDVYNKIRSAAFSPDPEIKDRALGVLRAANDPDLGKIMAALNERSPCPSVKPENGSPDGFIHQGKASWEEFVSRLDEIRKKELGRAYRKRLALLLKDA
ncbi:MAG: Mpv17/PMP22 family protein, partial [Candidatus Omnitrophica bacterium]|nr:Mpv17/PMP22 family protein [Candidatus Omnitrophota bacterium]